MPAELPISGPLGLGDLLDRAFRLYRERFWTLLLTAAIFLVPMAILSGISTGLFTTSVDALSRLSPAPDETPTQVLGAVGSLVQGYAVVFIMSILTYFVSGLVTLALTAQSIATLHGQRLTLGESVRAGLNRFWAFLGMSILEAICFFFATLIVLIPLILLIVAVAFALGFSFFQRDIGGANAIAAIGLVFGLLCSYFFVLLAVILPTIFLSARWIVATPGLVAQGWGPVQALQRSWALTRGQFLRCIGYLFLLWLLSLLVTGLPILVIQQFVLFLLPQSLGWATGISTALTSIANVLWQPLYVAALVLLYYDLRVRKESYDLALRVGRLEAEVRASGAPSQNRRPVVRAKLVRMGLRQLSYVRVLTVVLLMTLGISPAQGQVQPITLSEYTSQIQRTLEQLEQAPEGSRSEALRAAQAVFQNITAVALPSGVIVAVKPLLPAGISYDVGLQRLRLMAAQLAAADGDDFAARRALLEKILARPEFNQPGQAESLAARFLKWLRGLLPQDLPLAVHNPLVNTLAEIGVWVIAGVGAVLIVLLLSYWLQGMISNFVADVEGRRRRGTEEQEPLTAQAARQQAAMMARAGDYRGAVRRLYLAALLQLEENGLLRYDRSLTNREYLAQVASLPGLRSQMEPVVRTFDDVWYGVHEPDRATFERYEQEVRDLTKATPGRAAPDRDRYKTRKLTLDE